MNLCAASQMQPDGTFPDGVPNPYCRSVAQPRLLRRVPGGKAVYDTRAYWNTRDVVLEAGGQPVMGKTGHAFMKERMRAEDAVYGGEINRWVQDAPPYS